MLNVPNYTAAEAARLCPEGYKVMKFKKLDLSTANAPQAAPGKSSSPGGQDMFIPLNSAKLIDLTKRASPADYTKEQAVKDIFSRQFSSMRLVNVDGQLSVMMSEDFKAIPSAEDLASLEQQLQKDGTSPLMWKDFDTVVSRNFNASCAGSLTQTADALAANYIAQKNILTSRFEGDELTAQLDKLERSFTEQADSLATGFVENISDFLSEDGTAALEEKLHASVHAAIGEAVKNYEAKTAADPGLLTPAKGQDAWLNTHLRYVASRLQAAGQDKTAPASRTDGLFTLSQLELANRTVSQYRGFISSGVSEVTGAMSLAMLEMQTDTAMRMKGAGADFRQMMNTIRGNAIPKALDSYDKWLTGCRTSCNPKGEKPEWWSALDRGMFQEIYNATMSAYRKGGDALGAIRDGAAAAKQIVTQAVQDGGKAMRWTNAIRPCGYFDSFYGGSGAYADTVKGGYQNYVNQWQGFLNELGHM